MTLAAYNIYFVPLLAIVGITSCLIPFAFFSDTQISDDFAFIAGLFFSSGVTCIIFLDILVEILADLSKFNYSTALRVILTSAVLFPNIISTSLSGNVGINSNTCIIHIQFLLLFSSVLAFIGTNYDSFVDHFLLLVSAVFLVTACITSNLVSFLSDSSRNIVEILVVVLLVTSITLTIRLLWIFWARRCRVNNLSEGCSATKVDKEYCYVCVAIALTLSSGFLVFHGVFWNGVPTAGCWSSLIILETICVALPHVYHTWRGPAKIAALEGI